ncbi:unnamed protein product, partial [marine sediment metagenome]
MGGRGRRDPELLEIPGAEGVSVDFFTNLLSQAAPKKDVAEAPTIPLQQVAGMSGAEQTVQALLGKFLGTEATEGEAYKLGMGELKKTLGGEFYDPRESDFWKGYRETSEMEQEKGVAAVRQRSQLGGGLYATPGQRTEAEYIKGMGAERTKMLGGLYEKERDRRTSGIVSALGYAGFGEAGKLSRLKAGSEIGALPRLIKGEKYKAEYAQKYGQEAADYQERVQKTEAEYAEKLFPYQYQAPVAQTLMPQWYVDQSQPADPLGG